MIEKKKLGIWIISGYFTINGIVALVQAWQGSGNPVQPFIISIIDFALAWGIFNYKNIARIAALIFLVLGLYWKTITLGIGPRNSSDSLTNAPFMSFGVRVNWEGIFLPQHLLPI